MIFSFFSQVGLSRIAAIFLILCAGCGIVSAQTYEVIIYPPNAAFDDTTGEGLGGQQRVGGGRLAGFVSPENTHALLWTGDSSTPLDLHPSDPYWTYSFAADTDGARQVGYVSHTDFPGSTFGGNLCAALWNGTAASFTQLCCYINPGFNYYYSEALAVGGDQQVGYVLISGTPPGGRAPFRENYPTRRQPSLFLSNDEIIERQNFLSEGFKAVLWRGTAESITTLHPRNINGRSWSDSQAVDTDGAQQVGWGLDQSQSLEYRYRALLWNGTRDNFVDLTPPNNQYQYVYAEGVKNNVQVGYGFQNQNSPARALLWRGTPQSVVVMRENALAIDTNGTTHVGAIAGNSYDNSHAFRFDGETGAGFDLHSLLPPGIYRSSSANEIDVDGNIIGTAQRDNNGRTVAVLWRRTGGANAAPQINMVNPDPLMKNNFRFGATINLRANATDDQAVTKVEFYANNTMIGETSTAINNSIYQMSWLPDTSGKVRVHAKVYDAQGASSISPGVIIKIY